MLQLDPVGANQVGLLMLWQCPLMDYYSYSWFEE
jgi:hypothetical protein